MTKIHKVTLLIVDHDDLGADGVKDVIENVHYPNHCIGPSVMQVDTREVEWTDDHPLNKRDTWRATFASMFAGQLTAEVTRLRAALAEACEMAEELRCALDDAVTKVPRLAEAAGAEAAGADLATELARWRKATGNTGTGLIVRSHPRVIEWRTLASKETT